MERHEKLKLLRGLYCLTQEEMAALAKCHRSVYSTVEASKDDSRRFSKGQASALSKVLKFEDEWFNGSSDNPFQKNRFAVIDLDWSQRHLAVTANVRCRRINDAERAVKNYLPKMLSEYKAVKCFIGETDNYNQLFFFLFDQQGLFLRTILGQQITTIVEEVQATVDSDPMRISIGYQAFDQISTMSKDAVLSFLSDCKLDTSLIEEMCSEVEKTGSNRFDYMRLFGDSARKTTLRNICKEILFEGFTIDEIMSMLDELVKEDYNLKLQNSARP